MKARLLLIWNGIVVIRTTPLTAPERELREKAWREAFPGKAVQIITE